MAQTQNWLRDFWRQIYREPFIIYKYRPIKTKFCNFSDILTIPYSECSRETKEKIIYLLKSNYIQNDRILFTLLINDLDTIFIGHNDTPFISIYNEKVYKTEDRMQDTSNQEDGKNIKVEENPIGCALSYPTMFYYQSSQKDNIYTQISIYFIDFLYIHREHLPLKKTRELFQTHECNRILL